MAAARACPILPGCGGARADGPLGARTAATPCASRPDPAAAPV